MMRNARPVLRSALLALAAILALAATLACNNSSSSGLSGSALTLICTPDATSVPAGSASGVEMTVALSADGVAVPGRTLSFSATAGTVSPTTAVTGADGRVVVQFLPPSFASSVVITAQVADGDEAGQVVTSCTIQVIAAADPQVVVTLLAPAQLAGLTVTVTYNRFGLNVTTVEALGGLTGTDCFTSTDAPGNGTVTIVAACPSLRPVGSSDVARVTFDNIDGDLHQVGEFSVVCSGVDVTGSPVGTACSLSVTQL